MKGRTAVSRFCRSAAASRSCARASPSIGPSFTILDAQGNEVGSVKGDWKGWNFKILTGNGEELGTITKKWAGVGKELFTSADTYAIALSPASTGRPDVPALILAAGLAVDTVYRERK